MPCEASEFLSARTQGDLPLELFVLCLLGSDAYQLGVDEDASAVLTDDDLLVHLDLHLSLSGDAVEAAATSVALHDNHAQTVAGVLADALESGEQALFNLVLLLLGFLTQGLLLLLVLRDDFVELTLLLFECMLTVGAHLASLLDFALQGLGLAGCFVHLLLGKLDVQRLVLNLLGQVVILTVVANVVLVGGVLVDEFFGFALDVAVAGDFILLNGDLILVLGLAGLQTSDLVFQVLYFLRQFTPERLDGVNLGEFLLQVIERFQFLFNGEFFLLCCHNFLAFSF